MGQNCPNTAFGAGTIPSGAANVDNGHVAEDKKDPKDEKDAAAAMPQRAFRRTVRMASLPASYAGRTALGFGKKVGGFARRAEEIVSGELVAAPEIKAIVETMMEARKSIIERIKVRACKDGAKRLPYPNLIQTFPQRLAPFT